MKTALLQEEEHDATAERFARLEIDGIPAANALELLPDDPAVTLAVKLRELRQQASSLEKQAKLIEGRLRMAIGKRSPVALGDGTRLVVKEREGNTKWKSVAEELSFHVSEEEFQSACAKHVGEAYVQLSYVKQ